MADGYRWKDKDPVCDVLAYHVKQDGRRPSVIARAAHLTPQTVRNILTGKTCKPQNMTVTLLFEALGKKVIAVNANSGAARTGIGIPAPEFFVGEIKRRLRSNGK